MSKRTIEERLESLESNVADHEKALGKLGAFEEIVGMWSPCCQVFRRGTDWPIGSLHSGLCRGKNGGELGPTWYLGKIGSAPIKIGESRA